MLNQQQMEEAGLNVEDLQALDTGTNKNVGKKRPVKYKLVKLRGPIRCQFQKYAPFAYTCTNF